MKYAAAVTLYEPKENFIDQLLITASVFPKIYVFDNSADNTTYIGRLRSLKNIDYRWDGINHGLPEPFNAALDACFAEGTDWLCTLDQDSEFSSGTIQVVERYIESGDMTATAAVAVGGRGDPGKSHDGGEVREVETLICSGCFLNLAFLRGNGIRYDEAYFVDRFDADLCAAIRRSGGKLLLLKGAFMRHSLGDGNRYSALRNYYMFRNRFYYNRKYYTPPTAVLRSLLQTAKHAAGLLKEGAEGRAKLRTLPIAFRDFWEGQMREIPREYNWRE